MLLIVLLTVFLLQNNAEFGRNPKFRQTFAASPILTIATG